jgi:hypothetical protein
MTSEELDHLYKSFTTYAWRLEARDVYGVPEENTRLQAFLEGRELPRSDSKDAWSQMTAAAAAAERPFARVRMVGRPVTDYTRWEFSVYPENIRAGEEVRVLDRTWLDADDEFGTLWNTDFWLFDDTTAVVQNYADDGRYLGPTLAEDARPYVQLRARALELSVPYNEFTLLPEPRSGEQNLHLPTEATRID